MWNMQCAYERHISLGLAEMSGHEDAYHGAQIFYRMNTQFCIVAQKSPFIQISVQSFHEDFAVPPLRAFQTYMQSTEYFVPLVLGLDVRLRRKNSGGYPGFECQHRVYCRHQRPVWGDGERRRGFGTTLEGTFGRPTPGGDTNSNPFFKPLTLICLFWDWEMTMTLGL